MKKIFNKFTAILVLAVITVLSLCLLAACGGKHTYELVSVKLSDSEYNNDWIYVDDSAVDDVVISDGAEIRL